MNSFKKYFTKQISQTLEINNLKCSNKSDTRQSQKTTPAIFYIFFFESERQKNKNQLPRVENKSLKFLKFLLLLIYHRHDKKRATLCEREIFISIISNRQSHLNGDFSTFFRNVIFETHPEKRKIN